MKKYLLLLGIVVMMGAGCDATTDTQTTTGDQAQSDTSAAQEPTTPPPAQTGLQVLPAIGADAAADVDVTGWSKTTLRSGAEITVPVKGTYAPTWTYTLLENDDTHLQGGCYVTDATVYARTTFAGRENVCLTTTALADGPGTRTDYYVFTSDAVKGKTQMYTFTKTYPAGFDMNAYGAVMERVIVDLK